MSNVTTESEFDKELDRALTDHRIWAYGVLSERNDKILTQEEFVRENAKYQAQAIKAIRQAVDRHVIGEIPPESEHWRYNGELKGEINLAMKQRKTLYGGDEK